MSFPTISNTELNGVGATTLPNQPSEQGYSATQLKQKFDEPAKQLIAPKFNNLVDELEATTAAASLGAVAPTGRTGETVQAVINDISTDLDAAETAIANLDAEAHTHTNLALLETYEQTEENLADAVSKKHEHSNKALLDTYEQTEEDLADAVIKKHTHSNKTELDKITESGGKMYYGEKDVNGSIDNSFAKLKVGTKTLNASGEDTFELAEGANVTLTVNESNNTVTITSTGGGGGGGGDMYKSEFATNGVSGRVDEAASINDGTNSYTPTGLKNALDAKMPTSADIDDLSDVTVTSPAAGELLTYNSVTSKWENKAPDKSFVRYGGAKTFAELTSSLLVADNEDKFFLCTDGGTIASADVGNWTSQFSSGDVIPPDAHIAVINVSTTSTPDYRFDDFGGYIDISGKADVEDIPTVITRTGVTATAGSWITIPNNSYSPLIKPSSTIIPLFNPTDSAFPITYSDMAVYASMVDGHVSIQIAKDISNATIGILVINN